MSKRKKKAAPKQPVEKQLETAGVAEEKALIDSKGQPEGQVEVEAALRRVTVRVSEADLEELTKRFAAGETAQVTVHAGAKGKQLTDAQREWRAAYRQRPEVRERNKAYRRERAKRIRAAAKA